MGHWVLNGELWFENKSLSGSFLFRLRLKKSNVHQIINGLWFSPIVSRYLPIDDTAWELPIIASNCVYNFVLKQLINIIN